MTAFERGAAATRHSVILFTQRFPYGHSEQFIEPELPHLVERFGHVILVPRKRDGEARRLPKGIEIDLSLLSDMLNQ